MAFSNADKQQHGQSAQESLESILEHCKNCGYLSSITKSYRIGKPGYHNSTQFYAPFVIKFNDGTKWALFTTTSMRTDRIKGQQWDAINLKEIDSSITNAYLIYPDACIDKCEFIRQNDKYANGDEFSAINAIISQNKLANIIEQYAIKDLATGQIKDIQGNHFENRIAEILSYSENIRKWKTDAATLEGMHYEIFSDIVTCFELDSKTTQSIKATADKSIIGKLPSGGNPKTDVLVEVVDDKNYTAYYTISCKRSSSQSVSVHQYTADAFADFLAPSDIELRTLLNSFQSAGSLSAFGEKNCESLTERLAPYVTKLSRWVLGGIGGPGNPITQWADFLLTYNNIDDTTSIHPVTSYCEMLIDEGVSGNFGTPFSWTYPSKRRGECIQLKCKII